MGKMIDINTPQRFYQFSFGNKDRDISLIIDLKIITQISLCKDNNCKEDRLIINTSSPEQPTIIDIDENTSSDEMYSKLVTAWTTYKLATER